MNREELISQIAEVSGFTKKDSKLFLETEIGVIVTELQNGGDISLTGFGKLGVKDVEETSGTTSFKKDENGIAIVKPWTKEAHKQPYFKVRKGLAEAVQIFNK